MRRYTISQDSLDYMSRTDVDTYLEFKGFIPDWPIRSWDRMDTWETVFEQPTLTELVPANWALIFINKDPAE